MVFDAHDKAFAFVGGARARGIYDSEPLVRATMARKDGGGHDLRRPRPRLQPRSPMSLGAPARHGSLQQMCRPYLVGPVARTSVSGWGAPFVRTTVVRCQVEFQIGVIRRRFFVPRGHPSTDEFAGVPFFRQIGMATIVGRRRQTADSAPGRTFAAEAARRSVSASLVFGSRSRGRISSRAFPAARSPRSETACRAAARHTSPR